MPLRKVTIAPESDLMHEIFCVSPPSKQHQEVRVMRFSGTYGCGANGNGDARYMTAVTRAAISFTQPIGLVFDFTQLNYE